MQRRLTSRRALKAVALVLWLASMFVLTAQRIRRHGGDDPLAWTIAMMGVLVPVLLSARRGPRSDSDDSHRDDE